MSDWTYEHLGNKGAVYMAYRNNRLIGDMGMDAVMDQLNAHDKLVEALRHANNLLVDHEVWDGECPMNDEAECNATIIDPLIEEWT